MKTNRLFFLIGISTLVTTAGCETFKKPEVKNGQYWQRTNVSETVYINGPKAQQMLNRDIARCVTELRELESMGQIKGAIPMDRKGNVLRPSEAQLKKIDSPERDGYLFAEHKDYQSFEGCMDYAGWERTKTINYETVQRAEKNYFANHVDYDEQGMTEAMKRGQERSLNMPNYNE